MGFAHQALIIDVAAHAGTLLAALVYFRGEATACLRGVLPSAQAQDKHLLKIAFIASLPVVLFGAVLFWTGFVDGLRTIEVIAGVNLVFALLLLMGDRQAQTHADFRQITFRQALVIGLAQACALIPGASRAGVVITAARAFGFNREASARFALFLALPAIGGAVLLTTLGLQGTPRAAENIALACLIALLSFLIALAVLSGFIRFSQRFSLVGFVVYRLALSALLFMIILYGDF